MFGDKERIEFFGPIHDQFLKITEMVKDQIPEILDRRDLIVKNGFSIVAPLTGDNEKRELIPIDIMHAIGEFTLRIYPFLPEEMNFTDMKTNDNSGYVVPMYYAHHIHTIFINVLIAETDVWRGLYFLHELGHALVAIKKGLALSEIAYSQKQKIDEEVDMWTFDYKVMLSLGGNAYREKFERGVDRIYKWLMTHPTFKFPELTDLLKDLANSTSIFLGPPPCQKVQERRDHVFMIHCTLAAADQNLSTEDARLVKFSILQNTGGKIYKSSR